MYTLNLTDLQAESKEQNKIMTFFDSGSDDAWTIYPDGTIENFVCAPQNLTRANPPLFDRSWPVERRPFPRAKLV